MQLIKTPSFELACYIDGDHDAEKLFLCLPGFLDAGNYEHLKIHRAHFAGRGHLCVSFDPPGTFASQGDMSLYTVTNYLKAIDELIAHFGNRETIVLGHSLGGTMALLASFKNPAIIKTISIMSPYNLATRFEKYIGGNRREIGIRSGVRDMPGGGAWNYILPYIFVEDALQYEMLDDLKQSIKPKLFIMGKKDDLVDPQLIKEGYIYAGEPKQLIEVESYDHNYRHFPEVIDEVNRVVEEFLDL